jgi:uncharacterized protein YllA (UPF0747 family)
MERKSQFQHFNTFFPVLIRRNSALILTKNQSEQLKKYNLDVEDLMKEEHTLVNDFLKQHTRQEISLMKEQSSLIEIFNHIKVKAVETDPTLGEMIEAEKIKLTKQIEQIESKIKRSLKKREEASLNRIINLKAKIFPENGLQERHDNFFQYHTSLDLDIMQLLKDNLNPLEKAFFIFELEE